MRTRIEPWRGDDVEVTRFFLLSELDWPVVDGCAASEPFGDAVTASLSTEFSETGPGEAAAKASGVAAACGCPFDTWLC
jgi:hypothetical protein